MSNFIEDLERGKIGEDMINQQFNDVHEYTESNNGDLITDWGMKIEVKNDWYVGKSRKTHRKEESLFIERYSHRGKKTPGGPWRAMEDGSPITIYILWNQKCVYVYRNNVLADFLTRECVEKDLRPGPENSSGWLMGSPMANKKLIALMETALSEGILQRFNFEELPSTISELMEMCNFTILLKEKVA